MYAKVYLYKKQRSGDGGVTWQDVEPEEYEPMGAPIDVYDSLQECEALRRTIVSGYTCIGVDKYNLVLNQVSYDSGTTWQTVSTSAGTLIETNSYDCGYRTRITSGTPYCSGYDKYVEVYRQLSYDYGETWTTTATTVSLVTHNSEDCGYVPPEPTRYMLTLSDSSVITGACDSTSAVTSGEVSTQYSGSVVSATIGECTQVIDEYSFYNCSNLSSVTISDGVISIKTNAFSGCFKLKSVELPDSVINLWRYAFFACTGLTSVTFSNNIPAISQGCFYGCYSLKSITLPYGIRFISDQAFQYCSGLTSITIYAPTPPTLGNIPFNNTSNCPIYVPCESVEAYKSASGWTAYSSRIRGIPDCNLPITGKYELRLPQYNYVTAACDSSSSITLNEISAYSNSVSAVSIGSCVNTIDGGAFWHCPNLAKVSISNSVGVIGPVAFGGCSSLTNIVIPSSVYSIGNQAFDFCENLTKITLNAKTPPTLGTDVFRYADLKAIYVPASSVNAYKTASGWSEFASIIMAIPSVYPYPPISPKFYLTLDDTSIISVECDSTNTVSQNEISAYSATVVSAEINDCATIIGNHAFNGCSILSSVTIPYGITSIGEYAFYGCSGLTEINVKPDSGYTSVVIIPNSVTSIGKYAFRNCKGIVTVWCSRNITSIGDYAFRGCSELHSIDIKATTPPSLGNGAFADCQVLQYIYVPADSLSAYQSAPGWSNYANILVGMR